MDPGPHGLGAVGRALRLVRVGDAGDGRLHGTAGPSRGWRGEALAHLRSVTWPLTHLGLPGYHLNYALTDAPAKRLKILLVLLASGHGIGTGARRAAGLPGRTLARAGALVS